MTQHRFLPLVILSMSIAALAPACVWSRQSILKAKSDSVESEKLLHNGVRLRHDDLTLSIQPQTAEGPLWGFVMPYLPVPVPIVTKGEPVHQFAVWIDIDPGQAPVSFDPGAVTLTADGDEPLRPARILGPGVGGSPMNDDLRCGYPVDIDPEQRALPPEKRKVRMPQCINCWGAWPTELTPGSVPLEDDTCFVLIFAAEPFADKRYRLSVEGILSHGQTVGFPHISMAKGRSTRFEVINN